MKDKETHEACVLRKTLVRWFLVLMIEVMRILNVPS